MKACYLGSSLKWVNSCRYLGVNFVSGRTLVFFWQSYV